MEWLQTLLDSSTTPVLTAFLLGLLTAVSPCPLATNIAAIGFIGKDIENRRRIFLNRLAVHARSCARLHGVGYRIDTDTQRGFQLIRYSKVHREIRRAYSRTSIVDYRFIHAGRQQTQTALFRFQRQRRGPGTQRKLGCAPARSVVRNGILPHKRSFLLRNADPDVGHGDRRVSSPRAFRRGYRTACFGRRLDSGIQRTTYQQFLR